MKSQRVVVIGAGIGGLASALELSARGLQVLVLEQAQTPGGKMRQVHVGGQSMDAGPTVFTLRWVFEELFDAVGLTLSDHLEMQPVEVLARHAWDDTGFLDLYADTERSADAIGQFAGARAAEGYRSLCLRSRRIYQTLVDTFLRNHRPSPLDLARNAGLRGLPDLVRIAPFTSLWSALGEHFTDPRLRQLFGRYATYCGSSPFAAPATLMLVAHVEQSGVWLVRGGMHAIARTLAEQVNRMGATLRYGTRVREIEVRDGRACGVILDDGESIAADAVIFNGDVAALARGLLGASAVQAVGTHASIRAGDLALPRHRSLSALTWNVTGQTRGFDLSRHTVFFSGDYRSEFDDVFRRGRLPLSPTVYVCAQDRDDWGMFAAGPGCGQARDERMLWIVNAPALGDRKPLGTREIQECQTRVLDHFASCGLQIKAQDLQMQITTPTDFDRMFPATGGALYGEASHGWMASFSRPGARSRLPGLYLAGGSTHPGPGVPMAALSGRLASAAVLTDLSSRRPPTARASNLFSISRWKKAVMRGGT